MTAAALRLPSPARRPRPRGPAPVESDDEARYGKIDLKLIRRMLGALRPYRRLYALGLSLGLIHIGLEMAGPKFMQALINLTLGWAAARPSPRPAGVAGSLRVCGSWPGGRACWPGRSSSSGTRS